MHMHAAPLVPAPICSMNLAIANSMPQQQAHALPQPLQQPCNQADWSQHSSIGAKPTKQLKQLQKQQHSSKQLQQSADADSAVPDSRARQQRPRTRRLLRAMVVTGAATAVALAGAGIAAAALAPRMETLEVRYQQVESSNSRAPDNMRSAVCNADRTLTGTKSGLPGVSFAPNCPAAFPACRTVLAEVQLKFCKTCLHSTAVCMQVCKQQEELHEHTSQLADAKQKLQQQLTDLLTHQQQLTQHKQQLQQQVQQLQEQQQQHAGDKLQLQQRIEELQVSQQQLQATSAQLAVEVTAARDQLSQNEAASRAAAASDPTSRKQRQQQDPSAAAAGSMGDLQLQVTVPGFTDALVTRIGEAELVPKFAEALVNQVSKLTNSYFHCNEHQLQEGEQLQLQVCHQ